jgi:hypothetical protein
LDPGTLISIVVDAGSPFTVNLDLPGEDVLIRTLLGQLSFGIAYGDGNADGATGTYFYFDFLEIAIHQPPCPPRQ